MKNRPTPGPSLTPLTHRPRLNRGFVSAPTSVMATDGDDDHALQASGPGLFLRT